VLRGFLTGQAVAKRMATRRHGTILFTGRRPRCGVWPTSRVRHRQAGLRALAQSMAANLADEHPRGARRHRRAIDTAFIRENFPPVRGEGPDGILSPITSQKRTGTPQPAGDAWTFELDLRPWTERW